MSRVITVVPSIEKATENTSFSSRGLLRIRAPDFRSHTSAELIDENLPGLKKSGIADTIRVPSGENAISWIYAGLPSNGPSSGIPDPASHT
jgi:hypothetical protein